MALAAIFKTVNVKRGYIRNPQSSVDGDSDEIRKVLTCPFVFVVSRRADRRMMVSVARPANMSLAILIVAGVEHTHDLVVAERNALFCTLGRLTLRILDRLRRTDGNPAIADRELEEGFNNLHILGCRVG